MKPRSFWLDLVITGEFQSGEKLEPPRIRATIQDITEKRGDGIGAEGIMARSIVSEPLEGNQHDVWRAENFISQLGKILLERLEPSLTIACKYSDVDSGEASEVDEEKYEARKLEWAEKFKQLSLRA